MAVEEDAVDSRTTGDDLECQGWLRRGRLGDAGSGGGKDEGDDEEDPGQAPSGAAAQQMQGRNSRKPFRPRGPQLLTPEQYTIVMDKRLCLQCYKPGHRIGDAAYPEKGKEKRKPTKEEMTKA